MATLTIRNVEDDVVEALKKRARTNNRSLEAELRQLLADAAERRNGLSLRALADRIAAMTPEVPQTESTEILRQLRRERA